MHSLLSSRLKIEAQMQPFQSAYLCYAFSFLQLENVPGPATVSPRNTQPRCICGVQYIFNIVPKLECHWHRGVLWTTIRLSGCLLLGLSIKLLLGFYLEGVQLILGSPAGLWCIFIKTAKSMLSRFRTSSRVIFQPSPLLMLTRPLRPLLPTISITVAAVTNSAVPPHLHSLHKGLCECVHVYVCVGAPLSLDKGKLKTVANGVLVQH